MEYISDAGVVCQLTKHGGADAAHAEGQSEEQSCDHPHFSRNELLCIDQDG